MNSQLHQMKFSISTAVAGRVTANQHSAVVLNQLSLGQISANAGGDGGCENPMKAMSQEGSDDGDDSSFDE